MQWSNAAWFTTTLQFGWFNITPMQVRGITDKINLGHLVFDSEATFFFNVAYFVESSIALLARLSDLLVSNHKSCHRSSCIKQAVFTFPSADRQTQT